MVKSRLRKGISPLIAAVLLIAFTMAVATIAGPWVTDLLQGTQQGVSDQAVDVSKASNLGIEIVSTSYNRSSNELSIDVRNSGREIIGDDTNLSLNVLGDGGPETYQHSSNLEQAEIKTFNVPVEKPYSIDVLKASLTDYPVDDETNMKEDNLNDWWWDESWEMRAPVLIENPADQNLKNYQVSLEVDTEQLIAKGLLESDCSDLRFLSYQNNEKFDYWIKDGCNTESTEIWVKIPEIKALEEKQIYIFTDNSDAEKISSAEDTAFIYDLHGSGYNGELKWAATYNSAAEYVEFTSPSGGDGGLYYEKSPKPGFKAEFEHYAGGGSGADATWLAAYLDNPVNSEWKSDEQGYRYALDEWSGNNIQINYDGEEAKIKKSPGFDIDDSTWRSISIRFNGYENHRIYTEGNKQIDAGLDKKYQDTGNYFGWGARTGGSTNYHRVRKLTVKKYVEPKPKVEIGEWESKN